MPMIHGSFRSFDVAHGAVSALSEAGIPFKNPSFISSEGPPGEVKAAPPTVSASGMGTGGMIAAIATGVLVGGLAATGVGLFVVGPIAGLLAGVGIGGMAGSFVATIAGAGVAHEEAVAAQEALAQGRVVAILEVEDAYVPTVREMFAEMADAIAEKRKGGVADASTNEGEGNRTAARHYDAGVEKTIASGNVPALAREAQKAVDDPDQGPALKQAEAAGKRGPMSPEVARSR